MRSSMTIKQLDITDLASISRYYSKDLLALENYFLNISESRYLLFSLHENKFIACIENLLMPAWTLCPYHSKNFNQDLLNHAIDFFEKKKIYQFFTLTDQEEFSKIHANRYQPYLEHIVEKDQLTGYENIDKDVLQYKTHDRQKKIHLWVLRNEYRTIKK